MLVRESILFLATVETQSAFEKAWVSQLDDDSVRETHTHMTLLVLLLQPID